MDPRSQLLIRQSNLPQNILIVGAVYDDLLNELSKAHAWCWHKGDFDKLQAKFAERCHFFADLTSLPDFTSAVIFLPKANELTQYLIHTLANAFNVQEIFLVGEKRSGIASGAKFLEEVGNPVKLDSARHCQLWQVTVTKKSNSKTNWLQEYTLGDEYGHLHIVSFPGVFAHGRLDLGTKLLLDHLDDLPAGKILDYGSGAGVITAYLAANYPQSAIYALEVDAFACEATRLTLKANHVNAQIICSDSLQSAPDNLTAIVSNPPFHAGKNTNYEIAGNLIKEAHHKLVINGEFRMVINEFLPFSNSLKEVFGNAQQIDHQNGYKVWQAIKKS